MNVADTLNAYRSYLFSVAYHILGEIQEAEDIVQDSFAHFLSLPPDHVRNPKSYLTRVVANRSIDRLKERKRLAEHYPGTWLPEPYVLLDESFSAEKPPADMLSYGMMHLLEQLNPLERAVFILREAFSYPYQELAELLEISQDHCRQLLSRARKRIRRAGAGPASDASEYQPLLEAFLRARQEGDLESLTRLLQKDVVLYSDGGGKRAAAMVPLLGREVVMKFLVGLAKRPDTAQLSPRFTRINGQPGILFSLNGQPDSLLALDTNGTRVQNLYFVRNPDKIFLH